MVGPHPPGNTWITLAETSFHEIQRYKGFYQSQFHNDLHGPHQTSTHQHTIQCGCQLLLSCGWTSTVLILGFIWVNYFCRKQVSYIAIYIGQKIGNSQLRKWMILSYGLFLLPTY
jgi:hypothetical protein